MRSSLLLIGLFLTGLLLVGCAAPAANQSQREQLSSNPLAQEMIADQMIEHVTVLRIRADETDTPITDPNILRSIDKALVDGRAMQKKAHQKQDEGKRGALYGVNGNTAEGRVLLHDQTLYFDFDILLPVVDDAEVYLATHVSPHKVSELFQSGSTIALGKVQNYFGAQQLPVRTLSEEEWEQYRTVAVYSPSFDQVLALAQIRSRAKKDE